MSAPRATSHGVANDPAAAWRESAEALAEWAMQRLVNRTDVWGAYSQDGTLTMPPVSKRGAARLSVPALVRHFRARRRGDIVGAHCLGASSACKWVAVDIDWHSTDSHAPELNQRAALHWYGKLAAKGHRPLLYSSNGKGGYHLLGLLVAAIDSQQAYWYVRQLTHDFARFGYPARPECFPKQQRVFPDRKPRYGNWLRVVGKHYKYDHWPEVWDGSRWLVADEAVAHVLSLAGDPVSLVGVDEIRAARIEAYMAKLPHLSEGQGRDDVAFTFAAWLVRDLALSDAEAFPWLEKWDADNRPPKGPDRLLEILANAHSYGQRAYGSGVNGPDVPVSPPPASRTGATGEGRKGVEIIREWLWNRWRPTFKRGPELYSGTEGRTVKAGEAIMGAPTELIKRLAAAADAPRTGENAVNEQRLPHFFATWARSAWADIMSELKEEADSEEADDSAADGFRRALAAVLLTPVSLQYTRRGAGGEEEKEIQRRPLLDWCNLWASERGWSDVRGYRIWHRLAGGELMVALRRELFSQVQPGHPFARMTETQFTRLARQYGFALSQDSRVRQQRVVILSPAFVADLLAGPGNDTVTPPGAEASPKVSSASGDTS